MHVLVTYGDACRARAHNINETGIFGHTQLEELLLVALDMMKHDNVYYVLISLWSFLV